MAGIPLRETFWNIPLWGVIGVYFGGAIALGHPLGMSGTRLVLTAINQLETIKGKRGLATMCVGVGQGVSLIVERV